MNQISKRISTDLVDLQAQRIVEFLEQIGLPVLLSRALGGSSPANSTF